MKTNDLKTLIKKQQQFCLTVGLFLVAFYPTFHGMWGRWFAADSYYSHGFLIPLVSFYLIWQEKEELKKIEVKRNSLGLGVVLLGAIVYFFATQFRVNFIAGYGMFIILLGIVFYFLGWKMFKKISFPLFFLAFMLPLPSVAIVKLSWQLKMFAADLATTVLNNFRIPAIQEGSVIKMRHTQVIVDDVCSGLRSLISLTALGALFAYWFKEGAMWKRVLLLLCTIPTAVITNMLRVVILASVSEIWGAQYVEGFIHDATGYMIFIVAFLMLYFMRQLLD